jgi:hypothetical protein
MQAVLAASHVMQLLDTLMSPAQQQAACNWQGRKWYSLPQAHQQEAIKSSSMRRYPCRNSSSHVGSSSSQEMAGLLMLIQAAGAINISSSGSCKQAYPTNSSVSLSRATTSLCSNQQTAMGGTNTQVQVCRLQQLHS